MHGLKLLGVGVRGLMTGRWAVLGLLGWFFMCWKQELDTELVKARSVKCPVTDELINGLWRDQLEALLAVHGVKLESAKKRLLAANECVAGNTQGVLDPTHMEEFKFNCLVINPHIIDCEPARSQEDGCCDGASLRVPTSGYRLFLSSIDGFELGLEQSRDVAGHHWRATSSSNIASNHQSNDNYYYTGRLQQELPPLFLDDPDPPEQDWVLVSV